MGGSRTGVVNRVEFVGDFPDNSNNSAGKGNGRRILKGWSGIPKHNPGNSSEHAVPEGQAEQGSPIWYIWEPIKFPTQY